MIKTGTTATAPRLLLPLVRTMFGAGLGSLLLVLTMMVPKAAYAALAEGGGDSVPVVIAGEAGGGGAAVLVEGYRLFPGDILVMSVFDHPDLDFSVRVPASGATTFPLIGEIDSLSGRLVHAVQAEVAQRLAADYLVNPVVTIMVQEFGPRQAVVMGAVNDSAAISLNPLLPTTAIQAVGKAGGFAEDADRERTVVFRRQADGVIQALPVPSSDDAVDMSADEVLQHGDLVIVPRLDRIFVIGTVNQPGAVVLPNQERLTVSKAISLRGGFARFARQSGVLLIRDGENISVDVESILTGRGGEDPVLQPGDTVYVPASRF